jgi:Cys-rich protein (TIGR01571 family)
VSVGLDYLLYKDTDEWYIERQRFLKYDNTRIFVPDPQTFPESYIGPFCCRGLGVFLTCGLAAGTGGIFDLLWCYALARKRRQVRDMYHIDGDSCSDCFFACCCRCCMFNQLKHQLETDNSNPPPTTIPRSLNRM